MSAPPPSDRAPRPLLTPSFSVIFCAEDDPCTCDAAAGFELYNQEGICDGDS